MIIESIKQIGLEIYAISPQLSPFEIYLVQSPNVNAIGYYGREETMIFFFKDGKSYLYRGVPEEKFKAILEAPSVGSYMAREIKGQYSYVRVDWSFEKATPDALCEAFEKLSYHRNTTCGLWATDKAELATDPNFFQIKF